MLAPRDLAAETLTLTVRNDPILSMLEAAFHPLEIRRHARIGTNNTTTACALVEAGAGIALVEPIAVARLFPGLVQRPFRPSILVIPRVVSSLGHPMSRLARRFVQRFKEASKPPS